MAQALHTTHLFSQYLAGELSVTEKQLVETHILHCETCKHELRLLRHTVNILEDLPLATPPANFEEKLFSQIVRVGVPRQDAQEQRTRVPADEHQYVPKTLSLTPAAPPSLMAALEKVQQCGRALRFLVQIKVPLYACALFVMLSLLFSHLASEPPVLMQTHLKLEAPSQSEPVPSRQVATVTDNAIHPIDAAIDTAEQSPVFDSVPSAPIETPHVDQTLRWRVTGSDPTVLRQQIKAFVQQTDGATILEEQERLLLISTPAQEVEVLRKKLDELGKSDILENDTIPNSQATLLRIEFVQTPSVAAPPQRELERVADGS
ncbi:MAG: anti-sigma factor [Candidatus Binatia bacterium]